MLPDLTFRGRDYRRLGVIPHVASQVSPLIHTGICEDAL